jgi:hypothetical protein
MAKRPVLLPAKRERPVLDEAALAPKPSRPRPVLDQSAMYPKGLNGWERVDGGEGAFYPIYLCCYGPSGYLQERHGFYDEDAALAFANVFKPPA